MLPGKRYSRSIPVIGKGGQERLQKASVMVVGMGGLGCPASLYLAASGIGTLGLMDHDSVDESNLQRQILFTREDVGKPKALAAKMSLEKMNPEIEILSYPERLGSSTLEALSPYGIILDCTDSPETRLLLNSAALSLGKPLIHGAAIGEEGRMAVFHGNGCLECLASPSSQSCSAEGILPTVAGIIGTLQAHEAVGLALGRPALEGLLTLTPGEGFRTFTFRKNPQCPACGSSPRREPDIEIPPEEARASKVMFLDVREGWERTISNIPGSIHVPMASLQEKAPALDPERTYVTYCQTGIRSMRAAKMLRELGFDTRSLKSGIEGYQE